MKRGWRNVVLAVSSTCAILIAAAFVFGQSGVSPGSDWPVWSDHPAEGEREAVKKEIADFAAKVAEPPIEPRIDPVWKAIPGYAGLRLDEETTLRHAMQKGNKEGSWVPVFEVVAPKQRLSDLPPEAVYRGNPNKPTISLLINVAWGEEHLAAMLDILQHHDAKATFFFDGRWLSQHPEWGKAILAQGHEIGNHGYSHKMMSRLSEAEIKSEIGKTQQVILERLGIESQWFAPPAGDYDDRVVQVARQMGLVTILWTLDTVDWKHPPASQITGRLIPQLSAGSLILMHPTASAVAALPSLIAGAKEKGLAIETVGGILSQKRLEQVEPLIQF